MMVSGMRGLTNFISDIRNCQNKEAEKKRIDKELAHIRERFLKEPSMKGYDRKKYVCKLLYIFMVGYQFDFGHMEAVNLLSSLKYSEKQIGYLACALLLNEEDDLARLIINSVQKDLLSKNELWQCLALATIANIGGREMAETLHTVVEKTLTTSGRPHVRKRCAIAILRLWRKFPDIFDPEEWKQKVIDVLDERDMSVVTATLSLLMGLISTQGTSGYEAIVPKTIKLLNKIVLHREYPPEYVYYGVPNPWCQCKALRILQFFEAPTDPGVRAQIREILARILSHTETTKNANKNNASHSVLFEAINLIIHLEMDKELLSQAASLLGKFISAREPNTRYLGLETMSRLTSVLEDPSEHVHKLQTTIFSSLRDPDISIRRQALNMIYGMCDRNNSQEVVSELLEYLPTSDFAIRDELTLKVAILAEKFATEMSWYVDVMLMLISEAGDFVAPDVWWRVVQVVTNNTDLQPYAAKTVYQALSPEIVPETMIRVSAYILGEFGHKVQGEIPISQQFQSLDARFATASLTTKHIILTAFLKMGMRDHSVRPRVESALESLTSTLDAELQQRAVEYLLLTKSTNRQLAEKVVAAMPPFPERESSLVRIIKQRQSSQTDKLPRAGAAAEGESEKPEVAPVDLAVPPPSSGPVISSTSRGGDLLGDLMSDSSPAPMQTMAHGAQPVATGDSLLDGLLGVSAAPAKPATAAPSSAALDVMSLLGGGPTLSPATTAPNIANYERLLCTPEGTLYEDNNIAVYLKSEYHGNQGRVMLALANKTHQPLGDLRTFIPVTAALKSQMSAIPNILPVGAPVQQMVQLELLSPFPEAPTLQLSYMVQGSAQTSLNLKLPIVMAKFVEPARMQGPDFFKRWGAVQANSPQESVKQFRAARPITPESLKVTANQLSSLKFAVLDKLDPNPANLVAAGLLISTAGQATLLIRLETAPQQQLMRLTIRSNNSDVVVPFAELLEKILSA